MLRIHYIIIHPGMPGHSSCISKNVLAEHRLAAGEVKEGLDKTVVVCTKCGNKFETNSPFPKTTCPVCHFKTDVKKAVVAT